MSAENPCTLTPSRFISRPPIKRILKKANINRISEDVDEAVYEIAAEYTAKILGTTLIFTDHAPRKTIQLQDLEAGLRQHQLHVAVKVRKPDAAQKSGKEIRPTKPGLLFPNQEIPVTNFKELCKHLVKQKGQDYRFGAFVFALLQFVVENYIYDLSLLAHKCAHHANNRKTLRAADFYLARNLRGW